MKSFLIKIQVYLYKVKTNKLIILFLRKPFNTWIISFFYNEKKAIRDAEIWKNQKYYKSDSYKELNSPLDKSYIDYLSNNTFKEDKILDICCNQGRHLKALHKLGYRKLYGVDIMKDSINILKESKEYLEGGIFVESNLAQSYLREKNNNAFDYAITFSATIELMHPGFNIFKELNRLVNKGFIFVINEDGHSYPRFYRYQIQSNGFEIKNIQKHKNNLKLYHCVKLLN